MLSPNSQPSLQILAAKLPGLKHLWLKPAPHSKSPKVVFLLLLQHFAQTPPQMRGDTLARKLPRPRLQLKILILH